MQTNGVTTQPVRLIPEELSSEKLKTSINLVLNKLTGQSVSADNLANVQISEDVLYASIIHQRLDETHPRASVQFLDSMAKNYNRNVRNEARQPLTRAVDTFLTGLVTRKTLTSTARERLEAYAFGKSQLDNRGSTLARAPENLTNKQAISANQPTLDAALSRVSTNGTAGKSALQAFDARIENHPKLTKEQVKAQATVLERMLPVAKPVSPEVLPPPVNTTPEVKTPSETDKPGEIPDPAKMRTGPEDFTYKPQSELDGKALFIIPKAWRSRAVSGSLISLDEKSEILKFNPPLYGDDGRPYFRSNRSGKELEGGAIFRVKLIDNSNLDFTIPNLEEYFNQSY